MISAMPNNRTLSWSGLLCALILSGVFHITGQASDQPLEGIAFFEQHVRPLLIDRCYACHSEDQKIKGGLRLDLRQGWEMGGDAGRAIVPGQPEQSLLMEAVGYENPDLEMPPKGRLSDREIALLDEWIRMGAPDPRSEALGTKRGDTVDLKKGRLFWSFKPVGRHAPPQVKQRTWPDTAADHFILAALESHQLEPVEDAAPHDLLRRLFFDLTGLPPSPENLRSFAADPSMEHYERWVDQLLASKSFGEKWGRHWLDLARYAESTGGGRSSVLANAWRYRNYVIDAFNQDKPFDRFVREQIAGDLMPFDTAHQRSEQLIATAFLAIGPKNLDLQDKEMLRMNTVDEQIDTLGRSLLGMTIGCARCHAHKFDPIPMEDYYALAGILRSTRTLIRDNVSRLVEQALPVSDVRKEAFEVHAFKQRELEKALEASKKIKNPDAAQKAERTRLESELAELRARAPGPLPTAISVNDEADAGDYAICIRGNVHQLGDPVARGFLRVTLPPEAVPPSISKGQSGRLELVDWLTSPNQPLTARVYVNRIWHHLFGRGLVRTVDNFGTTGEPPSHPELLDYLAMHFMDKGWSTKQLVRHLVLSHTYRLGSSNHAGNRQRDPENALRWRMDRRPMTAEAMRDAILTASGQLRTGRIESMLPQAASSDSALRNANLDYGAIVEPNVRAVYIPIFREEGRNALLDAFDFANPSFTVGRRVPGVRPTQSLFLMNNDWVMEQSQAAAERIVSTKDLHPAGQLEEAYLLVLSRRPSMEEQHIAESYLRAHASDPAAAWTGLLHALFSSVDFRYLN